MFLFFLILCNTPIFLSCPLGYYQNSSTSCIQCDNSCESCSGPLFTSCITCRPGFYKHEDLNICDLCPSGCTTCLSPAQCFSCDFGYFLEDESNCQECADNCRTCTGINNNQCLSCTSGAVYDPPMGTCDTIDPNIRCSTIDGCDLCKDMTHCTSCGPGLFLSEDKTSCELCDKACGNCFGPGSAQCSDCNPGGTISGGNCLYNCSETCETCYGVLREQCLTCKGSEVLQKNTCIDDGCSETCSECDFQQNNTAGPYTCSACVDDYFLSGSDCNACPANCSLCTNESTCQQCENGYYLVNGICQDCGLGCISCQSANSCQQCHDGFFITNNQCQACNNSCRTCTGPNDTQCLSCYHEAQLVNNNTCQIPVSAPAADGLSVQAMKLIIGFAASACGLSCLITIVYKLSKKDTFYQAVEKEVKEQDLRRKSKANHFGSNAMDSNVNLNTESNDNMINYAGLTIVIDNKVANLMTKKKEDELKQDEIDEEEKKDDSERERMDNGQKNVHLETINESLADEEKSAIVIK